MIGSFCILSKFTLLFVKLSSLLFPVNSRLTPELFLNSINSVF